MNHAVRISEKEMAELRKAARLNSRSLAGQAEHWMRLGRALERNPDISYSRIEMALQGLEALDLDTLDETQQEDFLDRFADATLAPTAAQTAFFEDRRRRGLGVGTDDQGQIVEQRAESP